MQAIPKSTTVLVIGGGPAGSSAATVLRNNNIDVVVLEKDQFPRYHIGESLLPSAVQVLNILGVHEKVKAHGFTKKQGAYFRWGRSQNPWWVKFGELLGDGVTTYQVIRSEFDKILLDHAESCGAKVFQGVKVQDLSFSGDVVHKATYVVPGTDNDIQDISFKYLIDASGRSGVVSNRYLKNRHFHEAFKNIAIWGYWQGAKPLPPGLEGAILVAAFPDGWFWGIPLHNGTMSVGVVMHLNKYTEWKAAGKSLTDVFNECVENCPIVKETLESATLTSQLRKESDYSYAADRFCGENYFVAGDSACFIDPILSSGVHLAMLSGLLASGCITSIERGTINKGEAAKYYDFTYRKAYLRFMTFLSAFHSQNAEESAYFTLAQRLGAADCAGNDLKGAFLNLMSGWQDMTDVKDGYHSLAMQEMRTRIDENLGYRKDKSVLYNLVGLEKEKSLQNAEFFNHVEGLFTFSPDESYEGLYLKPAPYLHVARIDQAAKNYEVPVGVSVPHAKNHGEVFT